MTVTDLENLRRFRVLGPIALGIVISLAAALVKADDVETAAYSEVLQKQIIGPVATVTEPTTGLKFKARVDTGAQSCSMHVERTEIRDPNPNMRKNIGKKIRLMVIDPKTEKEHWIDSVVSGTVIVKNAEERERRYKVWVTLVHEGFEKRICVTLNDRSDMDYPILLGRNFLYGDYLVDVSKGAN